jgi:FAD/FMN-containing dehydrogenase
VDRRGFLEQTGKLALAAGVLGVSPAWAEIAASGPSARQLRELAHEVRGPVVTPASRAYGRDRLLYDTRFDAIRPRAIVYCESVADVQKAVRWARKYGVRIVPRCGGHSYAGYSTVGGGVVVDVSRIAFVRPNANHTAWIGAGAQLIDVYAKLWNRRVTIPAGSCPTVGISGLVLGGGVGFSGRKFGTTSDNVRQLTIVTADGRVRVCNAHQNSDLFWACRGGGGGNFGIVTSFVFGTHPVNRVSTFFIEWPWADAARVVRAWQAWAPHAPSGLFSVCGLGASGGGGTPTVNASGMFYGSTAALRRLLGPLLNAGSPSTVSVVSRSYMEATMYNAGCSGKTVAQCHLAGRSPHGTLGRETFKAKSDYLLRPLTPRGISTLLHWIELRGRSRVGGGLTAILDSYGGAINRVPKAQTAFVHRNALFSIQYYAGWSGSGATAGNLSFIRRFYAAMRPYVSGYAYQNYIDPDLRNWTHAYYGTNYPRLVAVKRKYDPRNVFHFAQSIRLRV